MSMTSKSAIALMGMMMAGAAMAAPPAAEFVKKAGASDLYEITSSKLVAGSTNAKLRTFASQMVRDHTKSTADVKAAAKKAGMTPPPPMLEPKQQAMVDQLKGVNGAQRDQLYISQQKASHAEALALMQDYSQQGDTPSLKTAATKIVPVVKHHKMEVDAM